MRARAARRGNLFFLLHDGEVQFSGYGLVVSDGCPHHLVGLMMIDRPQPASEAWLHKLESMFGPVELHPMAITGERGVVCQMWIQETSLSYIRQLPGAFTRQLQQALSMLLAEPPAPQLDLAWNATQKLWVSTFHEVQPADAVSSAKKRKSIPRFALGAVVATPGALEALEEAGQLPQEFLHSMLLVIGAILMNMTAKLMSGRCMAEIASSAPTTRRKAPRCGSSRSMTGR